MSSLTGCPSCQGTLPSNLLTIIFAASFVEAQALRDVRMHAEQQLAWILQRMGVTHQAAALACFILAQTVNFELFHALRSFRACEMAGRVTEGWSDCSLRVTARASAGDNFTLRCLAEHAIM